MINKQIFLRSHCPEIFLVDVPNIASVHGRLIILHQEPNNPLKVAFTAFTVALHGDVLNEVEEEKNYRVNIRMKTELKDIDNDANMKCSLEEEKNYQGDFCHLAKLVSSIDVEDIREEVKLKYTISLVKSTKN